ncbi:hypothetical protein [Dendrosporobacter sp. 1207_IL3150]|uniref:hypothetical protein n=1 Tax=Dendrosporobacter sp. 1207_IL3150 TaxID=3084054 RepID=UPI002FDB5885
MNERQITDPALLAEITIVRLQLAQNILLNLLNASSFQTSNLLRPETIDFVMDAYCQILCRLDECTKSFVRDDINAVEKR